MLTPACGMASFYYLEPLLESNPQSIVDVGCGFNFFKLLIPNLIGLDATDQADIDRYFDQEWADANLEKFDAAFSINALHFHPLENLVEFLPFLLLPKLIPIYWPIFFLWQTLDLLNNVLGHLGYEIYPKKWVRFPFLKFKTASTHPSMHHERFNGNYGLYFTFWDKLMKTEFHDYVERFQDLHNRQNS
jgi:hypothetical protein